jgi:hypothetical protein
MVVSWQHMSIKKEILKVKYSVSPSSDTLDKREDSLVHA